jgi:hypothetical protein
MAKIGFESNKRLVREFNNQMKVGVFDGKRIKFRSKFEYQWACYLDLLKSSGYVKRWDYEPETFYFQNERRAPVQYTPDFRVEETGGGVVYQETKGYHDGPTNSKLRKMHKHYPDIVMELVLQRIPKSGKGANRRRVADKYVRRVVDGGKILRQIGG